MKDNGKGIQKRESIVGEGMVWRKCKVWEHAGSPAPPYYTTLQSHVHILQATILHTNMFSKQTVWTVLITCNIITLPQKWMTMFCAYCLESWCIPGTISGRLPALCRQPYISRLVCWCFLMFSCLSRKCVPAVSNDKHNVPFHIEKSFDLDKKCCRLQRAKLGINYVPNDRMKKHSSRNLD